MNDKVIIKILLVISLVFAFFLQSPAQAQFTRTPWEMNMGEGIVLFGSTAPSHGHESEYDFATIPDASDLGWGPAPDPDIIAYSLSPSTLCAGTPCLTGGDFTYFRTFVDIPIGSTVTEFTISMSGVDDGVRVTIFNSTYPSGIVVPGSYVYLGGTGTADLQSLIEIGEINMVILTHVDDCCSGSYLNSASVVINGSVVQENQPPMAICQDITAEAESNCEAIVDIDDGSYDPDGDAITIEQEPAGPYPLGVTIVTLTVTDEYGSTDSCEGLVMVQDTMPPIISATVTPQDVPIGGEVSFLGTADDECDLTVEWDFGDGQTSTDIIAYHAYTTAGEYTAILTAVDSSGNVSTQAFTVVVSGQIEALVDIKPGSCPNPLNVKSKGVLPVAILGTEVLDVSDVDVASVSLAGVAPIRFDYEDVATPFEGELCDCHEDGPDGYLDLTLKFDTQEIVAALGDVQDGEELPLSLSVTLVDGTVIEGSDCIRVIKKGKK